MDRLSHLLPRTLKKHGLHGQVMAGTLVARTQRWIDEHLPQHAQSLHATKFQKGDVVIEADNPIALHECAQAGELLRRHLVDSTPHGMEVRSIRVLRSA